MRENSKISTNQEEPISLFVHAQLLLLKVGKFCVMDIYNIKTILIF